MTELYKLVRDREREAGIDHSGGTGSARRQVGRILVSHGSEYRSNVTLPGP